MAPSSPSTRTPTATKRGAREPRASDGGGGPEQFPIVGIGASAGGLRALQRLFGPLNEESGMAFVVILHLDPHHESQMAELLQASTAMPVRQVTRSVNVQPNQVYIIPPDKDLSMVDGQVRLSARTGAGRHHAPIDLFFRTLAEAHKSDGIGIVLSGTGSDGAQGVRWIKERGGVTMAQTPTDADYDGMPRNAIATGQVDVVLPAPALADELSRFRRAASNIELPADGERLSESEDAVLGKILVHVRMKTGQDFSGYKRSTVLRRLQRRMQFANVSTLSDYLRVLRDRPAEPRALSNDFLITVSSFFRDPNAFDALARTVVPALFDGKGPDDSVRAWVAGCATGEEAYSIAILLSEYANGMDDPPAIQVFASDVHEHSFAFAREGLYPESIAADVSPERLARFFSPESGGYRVKKTVREKVLFATHDLLKDPPFLRLDLVSCRNLLIYLQREAQQRVVELFHYSMRPGAYLFLGSSESIDVAPKLFTAVDKKQRIFRSVAGPQPFIHRAPLAASDRPQPLQRAAKSERAPTLTYGALHQQLVEAYAPPSLVVNADEEVVHLSSEVGRYLRLGGGEATSKLLEMVHGRLRLELRSLLRTALRLGKPAEVRGVEVEVDGKPRRVNVFVRPLRTEAQSPAEQAAEFALVVFAEQRGRRSPKTAAASNDSAESNRVANLKQLEEELREVKAQLRVTSEEHEATIEELRASNEELQSTTEEQRAIGEELETSKEELQSINEELRTINQEHRIRNEELAQLNSDLNNLIDSTDIGTIFVDRDIHIRRFTPPVTKLFNFVAADLGRPLSDVTHRLDYDNLQADVRTVLETLTHLEREVTTRDGRWLTVRLSPYRSLDDRIDGVVLTFLDTTDRKRVEMEREALLRAVQDVSLAKSNFIGVMSHEFRTPLNAVMGYADILGAGAVGPVTVEQRDHLERITKNARHLAHMVDDILISARLEERGAVAALERADLVSLVHEVAASVEPLVIAKGLSFNLVIPDEETAIDTDPTKLRQILYNLLGNAVRFTDRGQVSLRAAADETTIVLEVADTGIGIAPEHREQIFERFYQVDQSDTRLRGGSGVGLMVSRVLARALGGDVEVETALGRGSVFRVRLPREPAPRESDR